MGIAAVLLALLFLPPPPWVHSTDRGIEDRSGRARLGAVGSPVRGRPRLPGLQGDHRPVSPEQGRYCGCQASPRGSVAHGGAEVAASHTGLPFLVGEGGRMGAGLGVERTPTVVFPLDGYPLARPDWPFTEQELLASAVAPRGGPWQYLGAAVSLGVARTLEGEPLNRGALPQPLLVVFFSPSCPPCWDALPTLLEFSRVSIGLVVMAPHTLSSDDRVELRETGLKVVLDDGELARNSLSAPAPRS